MSTVEDLEDREDQPHTGWVPRVITGGKGPPDPPGSGENWLAKMVPGTTFVARHRRSNEVDYNLYHVTFRSLPEVVLLSWQLPDGKILDYYVDPERFSKDFKDYKILGIIQATPPDQGEEDDSNQHRPADVDLHASVQGEHHALEEAEEPVV